MILYQGENFAFCDNATGEYSDPVQLYEVVYGWACFDDHWNYEHTVLVPVPRDLKPYGIDTSFEDGTSLFKNGFIVFDTLTQELVDIGNIEPSFGSRYVGMSDQMGVGDYRCADYFNLDDEIGIYVMLGN